jgi:hypothetical protein
MPAGDEGMSKDTCKGLMFVGAAFITALILAFVVLSISGINTDGIKRALRITARFSFLLFWMAYGGGSLTVLISKHYGRARHNLIWAVPLSDCSRWIARHGRNFGLAFASAHSIHLLLVICLYRLSPDPPLSTQGIVFFSIGMLWTYLLAILSVQYLAQLLGAQWRSIRLVGMEYIMLAFQSDFLPGSLGNDTKSLVGYLPFALLGAAGTALRIFNRTRKTKPSTAGYFLLRRLVRYIRLGLKISTTIE